MEHTSEYRLLLTALRSNFKRGAGKAEAPPATDWEGFLRLSRFHRVQGLAARGLAHCCINPPEHIVSALTSDARDIASRNLQASNASKRLQQAFVHAGIDLLFVKGLTLGVRAYSTAWTKAAIDIDLLIREQDLEPVADMLEEEGYRLVSPALRKQLKAAHRFRKESAWRNERLGVQVDLHSRLSDNPRLISTLGMDSPRQLVNVAPNVDLPTLVDEHLLAYLAVHGASSAWFRLKWITDFAALVHAMGTPIAGLHRQARQLGAGRAIDQALLVADALFGLLAGEPVLRSELERDSASRRLSNTALRYLRRQAPIEPTETFWGTGPIHTSQFLLSGKFGYKASELLRQARAALLP